jgi:hypothetical protein
MPPRSGNCGSPGQGAEGLAGQETQGLTGQWTWNLLLTLRTASQVWWKTANLAEYGTYSLDQLRPEAAELVGQNTYSLAKQWTEGGLGLETAKLE